MNASSFAPTRMMTRLELESLESLPCGCVSAAYRAMPWAIDLVRLEAKGPHCVNGDHATGRLLGFGDFPDEDELVEAPPQPLS